MQNCAPPSDRRHDLRYITRVLRHLVVLALLFLSGCNGSLVLPKYPPGPHSVGRLYLNPRGLVTFDDSCSQQDRALAYEAASAWSGATSSIVQLRFGPGGMPFRCHDSDNQTNGHTDYWPNLLVEIDPDRTGPAALRTVIHEFGHAFGLDHDGTTPDAVMYTPNTGDPTIYQRDVNAFCKVWDCR